MKRPRGIYSRRRDTSNYCVRCTTCVYHTRKHKHKYLRHRSQISSHAREVVRYDDVARIHGRNIGPNACLYDSLYGWCRRISARAKEDCPSEHKRMLRVYTTRLYFTSCT